MPRFVVFLFIVEFVGKKSSPLWSYWAPNFRCMSPAATIGPVESAGKAWFWILTLHYTMMGKWLTLCELLFPHVAITMQSYSEGQSWKPRYRFVWQQSIVLSHTVTFLCIWPNPYRHELGFESSFFISLNPIKLLEKVVMSKLPIAIENINLTGSFRNAIYCADRHLWAQTLSQLSKVSRPANCCTMGWLHVRTAPRIDDFFITTATEAEHEGVNF